MSDQTQPEQVEFKVGLHIEDDPSIPASIVSIGTDPETGVTHILANNFETSNLGARSVAELLAQCSEAIYASLVRAGEHGRNAAEAGPSRPRFNPQPMGKKP
ncbi:hypothetical protein SEA_HIDDENLEAF_5 [Microbacterium phage Hiddenleaf]|nr:hypothetical protein SEA_HIDDENLEAF_5 [Microbacterium phage Hiddenleaf]QNN98487.1 hypothetical protein SEA_CHIVEY_5 [Microbacterium phage Chivey]